MARARTARPDVEARIESLSHEGRGIAHVNGKTTFIEGALPAETVTLRYARMRGRYDEGWAVSVREPSPERVTPRCPHFGVCGGCSLQHLESAAQVRHKEQVLLEQLEHLGRVRPAAILPALTAPIWGYRRKARLGAKFVQGKGGVVVGFRERHTPYIAQLQGCEVLDPRVGALIAPLAALITGLSIRHRIPQIEVAATDSVVALVLRHLLAPAPDDYVALRAFAREHGIDWYLQAEGPDSIVALDPERARPLRYRLPRFGIEIEFGPGDFTQVNAEVNGAMVERVVDLVIASGAQSVLDLYCGVGNFTLPLARVAPRVLGVEGDAALVRRARANAERNALGNVGFGVADLSLPLPAGTDDGAWQAVVLDPPRSGAEAVVRGLRLNSVRRVVYVSCNPATLARDAGILVRERGFTLQAAGVMDMFPHTAHVESLAVFDRP